PIVVWDVVAAKEIARYPGSWITSIAPDCKSVATVRPDAVHLIGIVDGKDRSIPGLVPARVQSLAFSPDSASLAVGSTDGAIFFYDQATLQQRRSLWGNAKPTLELAFSPDGTTLAALYDDRNRVAQEITCEVRLWQLATDKYQSLPAHRAFTLGFAPDGQTLATEELNGSMNLWDPDSGARRLRFGGSLVATRLFRPVFSPDGKAIVTAAPGGVQLRDTATGHALATLRGHSGAVIDAAFAADGRTMATGTATTQMEDAR